ncbi:spermidine coumaroyl-CoA acyltransferase [Gastrolobium bilobum]|uniref:spermidine coumaroyl-CoA acyltransferase n=1 Tax=Gastrolobium bilobum TaxID=150636 RepID=UPI002AB14BAB|nr:spermidine coumaroyl-CoA acyltransferase [Gastrolobium bilobum]
MQMIKSSESTLIFPSRPPFLHDHALPLSHLDTDRNLHLTFRYLRAYVATATTSHDPFLVISSSLSEALVHYYPLAGTLRRRKSEDRRLEIWCEAGQGVPLVRATVDFTLDSVNYLDDPASHFVEQLVPDPEPEEGMEHPCMLQVTVFKCGGFTLGAAMHHSLCDGMGGTLFFNAVAELARGATRITVEPVWNRERLLGPRDPPRVDSGLIREFLRLEKGFLPYEQDIGGVVRECFHVRDECLDKFKRSLFDQSGFNFTTFEALGAYIWRSKVRASGVQAHEKVKFAYSINIRRLVKPSLPAGYWGNGCVPMYVQLSAKDLIEEPIWETAELIKKSKSNVTDEYVRSFIDYQMLHFADGITAGKGVSGFTDWRHLGHSTVDFGWGGPVTVLPLGRNLLGSVEPCFFLPYSTAIAGKKEGFKVLVTLTEAALPAFREDMQVFASSQDQWPSHL